MTVIEIKSLFKSELLYLVLIVIFGFILYLYILTRYVLIYGVDGPYYLIQVRSILETGKLKYDDPPLALYIFTLFTLLFGGNLTLGIKVGTAFFSALSAAPFYFWVKKVTKSQIPGYLASLGCILSSLHLLLINSYLKMVVGTFFLFCFIYYLHCMLTEKGGIRTLIMAISFMVLTGATHAIVFLVAFLFLVLYAIVYRLLWAGEKKVMRNLEILLFMAFFFIIVTPIVLPFFFKDYYQALDLALSPFYRFRPQTFSSSEIISRFLLDPMSGAAVLAAIIFGIALWIYEWRAGKKEAVLAIAPVTVVGLLLLTPFIPLEWIWRFLYMEFITIAFVLGYGFSKIQSKSILFVIALFLCFSPIIIQTVDASKTLMPTIREEDYYEIEEMRQYIPPKSVIIVNPFYSYWVEYLTRTDTAFMFSPAIWRYEHVMILIDKLFPPTTAPNATKIFEGNRFILYEIEMKPP